jgi:hypothetical protein
LFADNVERLFVGAKPKEGGMSPYVAHLLAVVPVLRYRAMIHGISAPGLAARLYFNRYTEDAVDLCDILSSFAPHSKASLNELSKIMGLPGRPEGIDGNEVER